MRIDNPAMFLVDTLYLAYGVHNEFVQTGNTDASLSIVVIEIVVADVREELTIVKDPNAGKAVRESFHVHSHSRETAVKSTRPGSPLRHTGSALRENTRALVPTTALSLEPPAKPILQGGFLYGAMWCEHTGFDLVPNDRPKSLKVYASRAVILIEP
jgi:hypothetical protein